MAGPTGLGMRALASSRLARPAPKLQPAHVSSRLLPRTFVRRKSGPYGYTQAKALVFSQYGEPSEVLR